MSEHTRPFSFSFSSPAVVAMKRLLLLVFFSQLLHSTSSAHILTLRSDPTIKCKVYSKPSVHQAMDRICEMCHEMFSHERPNMRSECRSKCFRNEQFRSCLEMFSGAPQPVVEEKRTY